MQATRAMSDKDIVYIPYYVAEGTADRLTAANKRMWIMCILLIILLVGTNGLWIWYESQFMYYEQTVEQEIDSDGDTTVIGIGDNYGKSEAEGNR